MLHKKDLNDEGSALDSLQSGTESADLRACAHTHMHTHDGMYESSILSFSSTPLCYLVPCTMGQYSLVL